MHRLARKLTHRHGMGGKILSSHENMINQRFASLFHHEKMKLLDAIERDIRSELEKIHTDPHWADYHRYNALVSQRILFRLNPVKRLNT